MAYVRNAMSIMRDKGLGGTAVGRPYGGGDFSVANDGGVRAIGWRSKERMDESIRVRDPSNR